MAKKKKSDESKKVKEFFNTVKNNRENVPGFDSFYKLVLWFIFIFFVLLLVSIYGKKPAGTTQNVTTTLPANAVTYRELLDNRVKDGTTYEMDILIDNNKYKMSGTINNKEISGLFESIDNSFKYKIKEDGFYTMKFDEETLNNELLGNIDYNVINIVSLIERLENNKSIKTVENNIIKYNYNIALGDMNYIIDSYIENKELTKIEVNNDSVKYVINFK